jgi:hypothetical protein
MDLKELKDKVEVFIKDLKDYGNFPKENNLIDYKLKSNIQDNKDILENFLINFAKNIRTHQKTPSTTIIKSIFGLK